MRESAGQGAKRPNSFRVDGFTQDKFKPTTTITIIMFRSHESTSSLESAFWGGIYSYTGKTNNYCQKWGISAVAVNFCWADLLASWLVFLPGLPRGLRGPEGIDWWFDGPGLRTSNLQAYLQVEIF